MSLSPQQLAARLGVELTPWQEEVLERLCAGDTISWPRRGGRSTVMRILSMRLNSSGKPLVHNGGKP